MKSIKILSAVLLCAITLGFTSCMNDDDNNNSLTPAEVSQCYNAVKGTYTGKLIYPSVNPNNTKDTADTLAANWTINTDSTMIIRNFPPKVLASAITNTEIKEALEKEAPKDLNCYIGFVRVSPVTFLINVQAPEYTLTYGGKEHKAKIVFYGNSSYSFGVYTAAKNTFEMQIIEARLYIDDNPTSYINNGVAFYFTGKK